MNDQTLRVLMIDDSEDDVLLIIRELKKGGYHPVYERVDNAAAMKKALHDQPWDIILCDYQMPEFDAPSAINVFKEENFDIPIIIISGTIGEETSVECMRLGAHDYFMKGKLSRLCPAVARELADAKVRKQQNQTESQKEEAIRALRQSEEKYRTILENIEDGYYEVDLAGNLTFFNDSLCKIIGYSRDELMGMNNRQFTDQENSKLLFQAFNKVYKTGQATKGFDWQIIRKDGTKRYIEASVSLLKDASNQSVGFRGIIGDITERKQAEARLQQTLESLKKAVGTTIQVLVSALEAKDPYTAGHQSQVASLACTIAAEMGLDQDTIEGIRLAGVIHDIGKLAVPAEILTKPTRLSELEFSLIKQHPESGCEMLKHVESPWPIAQIVYQHHERINGTGYPRNLQGNEILLEARIMAVADVVDAMASHRPYRASLGKEAALAEIEKHRGTLYDSAVVDTCLKLFREKGYQHI
ncbi:MAG: HD domain-containing phosphohydrolase [Smithella sp.]